LNDVDKWTELVVVEWVRDMVTRYILLLFIINDRAPIRTWTVVHTLYVTRVFVHQRRQFSTPVETAMDLFLLLRKNAILRRVTYYRVGVDKRGAFG